MKISFFTGKIGQSRLLGLVDLYTYRITYIQLQNSVRAVRIALIPLPIGRWKYKEKYIYLRKLSNCSWFRVLWFAIGSRKNDEMED